MEAADGALRDFCVASRELCSLQEEVRARTREASQAAQAAQTVLRELLLSADAPAREAGFLAPLEGGTFRVRVRPAKAPTLCTSPASADALLRLWDDPGALEERLAQRSNLDPVASVVQLLLEAQQAQQAQVARAEEPRWRVEVAPYKPKADGDDGPPVAPPAARELVETYLGSREASTRLRKEALEQRRTVEERRDTAAERVLPELQALPAERRVQRLNLRDAQGRTESFFLRVKAPRKLRARRLSAKLYREALRSAVEDTVNRFCVDAYKAPGTVSRREFGEELCAALRALLQAREAPPAAEEGPRIALDRVRARSAAGAGAAPGAEKATKSPP